MTCHFKHDQKTIAILGQTFPVKDQIKSLTPDGAKFNGVQKCWEIKYSEENLKRVQAFCVQTGGGNLENFNPQAGNDALQRVMQTLQKTTDPSTKEAQEKTYQISELTSYIQTTIQKQFPTRIWVEGEIMQISKRATGTYITLAEKESSTNYRKQKSHEITAIAWRNSMEFITQKHQKGIVEDVLQEGLKLRAHCQVSFYKQRAQVNLEVFDIDPAFTKGLLAIEKEKTIKKLKQLQIIDQNKQQSLRALPTKIGLITGKDSRAESDFIHQLEDAPVGIHVYLLHSAMQGEKTKPQVLACIEQLQSMELDAIVITRGGGSAADLRWFDDFDIAQSIALAKVPVIAAIGHHDDYSIAEMVAHQHVKTPTAAAEFFIQRQNQFLEKISNSLHYLRSTLDKIMIKTQKKQAELARKLAEAAFRNIHQKQQSLLAANHNIQRFAEHQILAKSQKIQSSKDRLGHATHNHIANKEKSLISLLGSLKSVDPTTWLNKGWTQLVGSKSQPIKSIHDVNTNDTLTAQLLDGKLKLSLQSKEPK